MLHNPDIAKNKSTGMFQRYKIETFENDACKNKHFGKRKIKYKKIYKSFQ